MSIAVWQGLGAPVGTMLGGSKDFIQRAVRARKALGGGMRQSGILAAAGRISLSDLIGRMEEDHRNTKRFAQGDRTPQSSSNSQHTGNTLLRQLICSFCQVFRDPNNYERIEMNIIGMQNRLFNRCKLFSYQYLQNCVSHIITIISFDNLKTCTF